MALLLPFTEVDLKVAAGPRSFDRGLDYVSQVRDLDFDGPEITATVYGSDTYEVCLTIGTGRSGNVVLIGDCSCPFGEEGNFCKHCVATGLAAIELAATRQAIPAARQKRDLLVPWLASLSKDELVAEILELLDSDRDLRRRFELRAAARQANVHQVRSAVQNLVDRDGFIEYDEARDYARDVSRAAEAIDALIDGGAAEDAIDLARDALDWVTEAYGSADDSCAWSWNGPVLIEALLDDGDLDAAWTAADGGATQDQRIRLADALFPTRPADALAVYLKAITPLTEQTGDKVYHQIARLLLAARACHETLGTPGEFRQYLTLLRMSQKRKRNLMAILADNGL